MRATLSPYTAPTAEPISLTEAKLHLRLAADAGDAILYDVEDAQLTAMISAARAVAEVETWKALVLQSWDLFLDAWPCGNEIRLPVPPLRKVESIQYTDSSGVVYTMETTDYEVDTEGTPGRVVLGYQKSWPSVTLSPKNPIRIRFRAGYIVPFTVNATTDTLTAINHPFIDGDKIRLSVSGGTLPAGLAIMTDFYARDVVAGVSLKLAATAGGAAIDLTTAGTGAMFLGEIPTTTIQAMKLIITDLYEERGDTVTGNNYIASTVTLPRGASHLLAMDSAREF
jgi:uncharacterized phiE125 gp8 family phage protein